MKDETLWAISAVIAAFVMGLAVGVSATNESWTNDCDVVGKHRSVEKAYFCFPEGGK